MFDKDEKLKRYINDSNITSSEKIAAMNNAAQVSSASIGAGASMYATDARLKEAGMTLEAQNLMQQAGFAQQDKTNMTGYKQQNFQAYTAGVNNIQMSEAPPEAKVTAAKTWNALFAGSQLPDGFVIDTAAFIAPSPTPAQGG
jgi:hypothetical protein